MMGADINEPLLLPLTVAMGHMTSNDHSYCWAHGTRAVATTPIVATGVLTLVARRHWHPQ
jgi:hypothetical protein